MQPRASFDRALLISTVLSIISILIIGWIFLTGGLGEKAPHPTAIPSSLDKTFPTATRTNPDAYPEPSTETPTEPSTQTPPSTSTVVTESLPTPSATPTPDRIQPLVAGKKYDDTDPNIAYDPNWTALKNPSTVNSYKGTIHASSDAGSKASFRFTGKQFLLGYKRAKNFGTVTVMIDDQPYSFNEQAFDLSWRSPKLSPGDHFVQIIHDSGESVNLDYIEILD